MFLMDTRVRSAETVSCGRCAKQTAADADCCESCGFMVRSAAPVKLVARIKRALGIELSSEIVAISLEDDRQFFSAREIDSLLELKNLTVLGLEDVPDYAAIFYHSKRIRKPVNRLKS